MKFGKKQKKALSRLIATVIRNNKYKINNANKNEKTLIFSSSRVATELLKCLDEEIAHYHFNLKEVT